MKKKPSCDCCLYYEFDEEFGFPVCTMPLDEDEQASFRQKRGNCPYFRWYDEYKSVQKQN